MKHLDVGFLAFAASWMLGSLGMVRAGANPVTAAWAMVIPAVFLGILVDVWVTMPRKKDDSES